MSTPLADYMLLFRTTTCYKDIPPEVIEKTINDWMAWFDRLKTAGTALSGHPLESTGRIVSAGKDGVIADGPFAESKETIGGYFFLRVKDLDEAVSIAKQCPGLPFGAVVEVRPVPADCPDRKKVAELRAKQVAAGA